MSKCIFSLCAFSSAARHAYDAYFNKGLWDLNFNGINMSLRNMDKSEYFSVHLTIKPKYN